MPSRATRALLSCAELALAVLPFAGPSGAFAGQARRAPSVAHSVPSDRPQVPALPASSSTVTDIQPWTKTPAPASPAPAQPAEITPRELGPQYFQRWSYSGPSRRGRAYDVKPRENF